MNEITELPWMPYADRYVAFIELVEYVSMNREYSVHEIYHMMSEIHEQLNVIAGEYHTFVDNEEDSEMVKYRVPLIKTACAPDSILVMSATTGIVATHAMVMSVMKMFFHLLGVGIPCRGGIAKGECVVDFERSLFLGNAFAEAKTLSKELSWYGIAMPPNVLVTEKAKNTEEITSEWIPSTYECVVPTITGKLNVEMLNWPAMLESESDVTLFLQSLWQSDYSVDPECFHITERLALEAYRDAYEKRFGQLPLQS